MGGQYRCGFIHDKKRRVLEEGADNFHPLTLPYREIAEDTIRFESKAVAIVNIIKSFCDLLGTEGNVDSENDIFGHRERVEEGEMLKDHPNAALAGPARVGHPGWLALPENGSGVRLQHPVDHFDESTLSRPVLAKESVYLASGYFQIYLLIGDTAGKSLSKTT